MLTVTTAAATAREILDAAETDPVVFHNIALVSEAVHVLKGSKRKAMQDLGETLKVTCEAYHLGRAADARFVAERG